MPITTFEDISFVLSGGSTNLNPNAALGGEPSSNPIVNAMVNNLFNDISPDQARDGYEDYRCFYMFNDGPTSVYAVKLWIASEYDGGASVQLGVDYKDELQRLTVGNVASGGSLTLSYNGVPFTFNHNTDLAVWATNFQIALNNIATLGEVRVIGQYSGSDIIFDITFTGRDGRRNHPELVVVSNNLTPATMLEINTIQTGSPTNTIAAEIGVATNPPGGVTFFVASESVPISIPRLDPEDGLPIWVKRTIVENATAVAEDGFVFRFSAESLEQ